MKLKFGAMAFAAMTTSAFAQQSNVTISGQIDLTLRQVDNGVSKDRSIARDGASSSRLRFTGTEDLGGGLKAGFFLDAGLRADTGQAGSSSKFWDRRSTVSLFTPYGEIRLGRDNAIQNSTPGDFDALDGKGVGNINNIATPFNFSNASTFVRVDNAVSYVVSNVLGGFYGQVQVTVPKAGDAVGGRYRGVGLGYEKGPIHARITHGQTDVSSVARIGTVGGNPNQSITEVADGKFKYSSFGASYDFRAVKVMGSITQWKSAAVVTTGESRKQVSYNIGAIVPVATGTVNFAYTRANRSGLGSDDQDASQFAVTYKHDLSKRTQLYASVAHISQDQAAADDRVTTPSSGSRYNMDGTLVVGRKATGFDFGIRHRF